MTCPLPVQRVAEHVGEIIAAVEWASFQSEYGVSEDEWLRDHHRDAEEMAERWWAALPADQQKEWIARYRSELVEQARWIQLTIDQLDSGIVP